MGKSEFKVGDKAVRLYGLGESEMRAGDVGTVDKITPHGDLSFTEYPGRHEYYKFVKLSQYPQYTPKELVALWDMIEDQNYTGVLTFVDRKFVGKKKCPTKNT